MTWAHEQRIAFIKERMEAGGIINRKDMRDKFLISLQTATSDFHEFQRRYPGVMRYCGTTKAMVPSAWVPATRTEDRLEKVKALVDLELRLWKDRETSAQYNGSLSAQAVDWIEFCERILKELE